MSKNTSSADAGSSSADGMGSYSGVSSSGGKNVASFREDDIIAEAVSSVGIATLLPDKRQNSLLARIYRLFGASSQEDKMRVVVHLAVYFSVHGTSPHTMWAAYAYPITVSGTEVPPIKVVELIGADSLKRFLGRYGNYAINAYSNSLEFRKAMRERVARAGLSEEDGYLAIDFVGKDGSLDGRAMDKRRYVRSHLVSMRNSDLRSSVRNDTEDFAQAREVVSDSRSADPFRS